jgi:hypothetical protein
VGYFDFNNVSSVGPVSARFSGDPSPTTERSGRFTIEFSERLTECLLTQYRVRLRLCLMKQCPQCSTEYGDNVNFCANDGRSLVAKTITRSRLCPQCANSIPEESANCPYCKATLAAHSSPEWSLRDRPSLETGLASQARKRPFRTTFIWLAGMLVVALAAFFIGGHIQRSQLLLSAQENIKGLQEKDQKIQVLEGQLARVRQDLNENTNQLAESKTKLQESQKDLSLTQQRLTSATREVDRLSAARSQGGTRTVSRPADPAPAPPPPPAATRRAGDAGVFETTRATTVYEGPSPSSRVLSQISKGTRINVVGSAGDWLEVRSKRGNPPGYVRSDDARPVGKSNSN